jgi:hypothetical protein
MKPFLSVVFLSEGGFKNHLKLCTSRKIPNSSKLNKNAKSSMDAISFNSSNDEGFQIIQQDINPRKIRFHIITIFLIPHPMEQYRQKNPKSPFGAITHQVNLFA